MRPGRSLLLNFLISEMKIKDFPLVVVKVKHDTIRVCKCTMLKKGEATVFMTMWVTT